MAVGPPDKVSVPEGTPTLDCKALRSSPLSEQHSPLHRSGAVVKCRVETRRPPHRRLEDMLTRYGFTTVVDTASDLANTLALRRRIESGELKRSSLLPRARRSTRRAAFLTTFATSCRQRCSVRCRSHCSRCRRAHRDTQLSTGADIVKLFTGSGGARQSTANGSCHRQCSGTQADRRGNRSLPTHQTLPDSRWRSVPASTSSPIRSTDTRGLTSRHFETADRSSLWHRSDARAVSRATWT